MRYQILFLLKLILSKYIDKDLIYRKKVGFGMLLTNFLNYTIPTWIDKGILNKKDNILYNFIDINYLKNILKIHQKHLNQGYKLWVIYSLMKFMDKNNT